MILPQGLNGVILSPSNSIIFASSLKPLARKAYGSESIAII
jgi:hypothetical protein